MNHPGMVPKWMRFPTWKRHGGGPQETSLVIQQDGQLRVGTTLQPDISMRCEEEIVEDFAPHSSPDRMEWQ